MLLPIIEFGNLTKEIRFELKMESLRSTKEKIPVFMQKHVQRRSESNGPKKSIFCSERKCILIIIILPQILAGGNNLILITFQISNSQQTEKRLSYKSKMFLRM